MCSSVHKSANIHFIMNRGCGNIARTNLINRLLFYALYGDKIIASEGYLRVYSNRDDLGACSNNLLYIGEIFVPAQKSYIYSEDLYYFFGIFLSIL